HARSRHGPPRPHLKPSRNQPPIPIPWMRPQASWFVTCIRALPLQTTSGCGSTRTKSEFKPKKKYGLHGGAARVRHPPAGAGKDRMSLLGSNGDEVAAGPGRPAEVGLGGGRRPPALLGHAAGAAAVVAPRARADR